MNGVITGGWSFVVAAYSLTTAVLLIYTITLLRRFSEAPRPGGPEDAV